MQRPALAHREPTESAGPLLRTPETADARLSVTLSGLLMRVHRVWARELRAVLLARGGSGTAAPLRHRSERYLRGPFRLQLERELDALAELVDLLPPPTATSLLSDGVLIGLLGQEMSAGADPNALARFTPILLRAMEHWFAEVERAVGWIRQDTVPVSALRGIVGLLGAGGSGADAVGDPRLAPTFF